MLFMNPSNTSIADLDIGGSTIFSSTSIHEFKSISRAAERQFRQRYGVRARFSSMAATYQYDPSVNAIWVGPVG